MILSYKECIEKYKNDYQIQKQIVNGKLFKIKKGVYSDNKHISDIEYINLKHKDAIVTGESAFYYHNLTDAIPIHTTVATARNATRIKNKSIKQEFQTNSIFSLGKIEIESNNKIVRIYSKERMLVELIRFKKRYSYDYYKEIINNYRNIVYELDFKKVEKYAKLFSNSNKIIETIMLEVL